jgi:hypothetical protein
VLKWTLIVGLGLVAIVIFVAIAGALLPKGHRASRTATIAAPPAVIFGVITDFARGAEWRRDVKEVEVLPDDGRGRMIREHGSHGVVPYRVEVFDPPARLVMRIADPSLPYGGSWTYELRPDAEGASLTITEEGEVYNPIFRFMQKVLFSPYTTMDQYIEDLKKRLSS